jgi:hypothetical protein
MEAPIGEVVLRRSRMKRKTQQGEPEKEGERESREDATGTK